VNYSSYIADAGVNRTEKQIKTRLGTEATIAKKKKLQESSVVKPGRQLGNKNIVSIKSNKKLSWKLSKRALEGLQVVLARIVQVLE
jgi:predicted naringenin-chalcone synthase